MNTTAITVEESNTYLSMYTTWLNLNEQAKKAFIARGSVYAQTQWTCVDDVVWEGTPAIPDEIKEAVAYYAYADYNGKLYGDPANPEERRGGLRATVAKVGDLMDEVQYFQGGSQTGVGNMSSTGYADSLMRVHCEKSSAGSISLVRV